MVLCVFGGRALAMNRNLQIDIESQVKNLGNRARKRGGQTLVLAVV
jgi:hypothetical protein